MPARRSKGGGGENLRESPELRLELGRFDVPAAPQDVDDLVLLKQALGDAPGELPDALIGRDDARDDTSNVLIVEVIPGLPVRGRALKEGHGGRIQKV